MTRGERGETGVRALLERFDGQHTARARYVTSVIESGLAALERARGEARSSRGG